MATARDNRGRASGEAEEADRVVEKERVVDPPRTDAPVDDAAPEVKLVTVTAVSSGLVTAPSGASFALQPGVELKVLSSDVDFLVSQGHASTES